MNNITIIGRLAQDPTVGKSKSNGEPVTLFNIASDSSFPNKTDFIHCMANYQTGKYVAQYGAKGMTIYAEGELTTDEYTNRDGVKIPSTTIIVRKVKFLSKNPNMQDNQQSSQSAPRSQQQGPAPQNRPQQQAPAYRNTVIAHRSIRRRAGVDSSREMDIRHREMEMDIRHRRDTSSRKLTFWTFQMAWMTARLINGQMYRRILTKLR